METRVPAVCRMLYVVAGALILIGLLVCLNFELTFGWLALLVYLVITTGALLGGCGVLVQDRIENPRHRE